MASITPKNGRADFITAQDPHTYWELNSSNLGTNFGRDTSGYDDNTNVGSGDISTQESYEGMNSQNDPQLSGWMDEAIITDACCLLYIPAGLTHDYNYGIFHNGGGTNAQGGFLRATTSGVEIACAHNDGGDNVDAVIHEIPDADLPGWFAVGFQFASYGGTQGDMALWINGVAEAYGTRARALDWGGGNPDLGNNGGREPNESTVIYPVSYSGGDWGGNININGSGILIANFTCDNPGMDGTRPADSAPGAGNDFHTDFYEMHAELGTEVLPSTGELALTGFVPTIDITEHQLIITATGELALVGYEPTVVASDHQEVSTLTGELTVVGYAPTVGIPVPVYLVSSSGNYIILNGYLVKKK